MKGREDKTARTASVTASERQREVVRRPVIVFTGHSSRNSALGQGDRHPGTILASSRMGRGDRKES